MKRKSISKRIRFEIFKRDGFCCAYCGSKPPEVILHVDHIVPVSKGGTNDILNLITSCLGCNIGKSNIDLTSAPVKINSMANDAKERSEQFKAYSEHLLLMNDLYNEMIDRVEAEYQKQHPNYMFTDKFRLSVKKFIIKLDVITVIDAMAYSASIFDSRDSLKYFCGICWNKIRENV